LAYDLRPDVRPHVLLPLILSSKIKMIVSYYNQAVKGRIDAAAAGR
jgi:hypothetical protein